MTEQELFQLQYNFENNVLKETDLSDIQKMSLMKLYNAQNNALQGELKNIKQRLANVTDKYIELKNIVDNQ